MKNRNYQSLSILLLGGLILTLGDIVAAHWIRLGGSGLYMTVFVLYLVGMIFLVKSYKTENIPVASITLVIFNVVILFFAGILFFDESVNFLKVFGIALCFVSIFLLESGKRKKTM